MASLNMAPEELKQLELLRNRFAQLTSSLASLRASVLNSNPLPTRESLQASAGILQQNIRSLVELATENAGLLQRVVVHPSTNFPGRTQEHVLLQLVRKKLEPDVEGWVEEARAAAAAAGVDASKLAAGAVPARGRGGGIADDDYDEDEDDYGIGQGEEEEEAADPFTEQWADMQDVFLETLRQYVAVQVKKKFTVEEQAMGVEKVRTGLRQSLEESDEEEEDEEDEDEEDEDEGAAVPAGNGVAAGAAGAAGTVNGLPTVRPEHVLWLATRGNLNLPRNIPFTSQQR